jgi:hypothetical protein
MYHEGVIERRLPHAKQLPELERKEKKTGEKKPTPLGVGF